ncbi:MAG TPA: DAK2 domain-containing protein, partial [Acidimicrobiales bacterium]
AGGTSGILWGLLLETIGEAFATTAAPDAASVAGGVRLGAAAVARVGRADLGDKTMLDVLIPFADRLDAAAERGASLAVAWSDAADRAGPDAAATAGLRPRVGRARPLAERSIGTPDAGAVSMALCVKAVAGVLNAADRTDVGPTNAGATNAGPDEGDNDREETQS